MIEKIKQAVIAKYKLSDNKGMFISAFGHNGELLLSNGVVVTDKSLDQIIETMWLGIFAKEEKNIKLVVVDIVIDSFQETDPNKLVTLDMTKYGLFVSDISKTNSGVLLPNTVGVADLKHGLYVLKQKYPKLTGNVLIWAFGTDRIVI